MTNQHDKRAALVARARSMGKLITKLSHERVRGVPDEVIELALDERTALNAEIAALDAEIAALDGTSTHPTHPSS